MKKTQNNKTGITYKYKDKQKKRFNFEEKTRAEKNDRIKKIRQTNAKKMKTIVTYLRKNES